MFNDLIINNSFDIIKFLNKLNLDLFYSSPQLKHIAAIIMAMIIKGFNGKVSDVHEATSHRHHTTIGKFLNNSTWNESFLSEEIRSYAIKRIWQLSQQTKEPIYVIIDDTVNEKTVPSSKAQNTIQGCSFHRSHLRKKSVYGHQFVTVMLRCGDTVLPFDIVLYEKDSCSKIQLAQDILALLPPPVYAGYVLADSWYSCEALFNAAAQKGYCYLGALKTNRKIFPRGHKKGGIPISSFVKTLKQHELDLVTVGGKAYYTYTYLGKIKGARKVKIVISWPENALWNIKAMKAFVSLDIEMSGIQLLGHYIKRWPIETFFRETKKHLGFDKYQIHTLKGIRRYMYLLMLTYLYCELEVQGDSLGFSKGLKKARQEIKNLEISWIYRKAQEGIPLADILKIKKVA